MEDYLKESEIFIRKSISEEQKTLSLYQQRKLEAENFAKLCRDNNDEITAKKFDTVAYTLQDIMEEEQIHIGQFTALLPILGGNTEKEEEGKKEGQEDINKFESFVSVARKIKEYLE